MKKIAAEDCAPKRVTKTLSVFMAASLMAGMVPSMAFAEESQDADEESDEIIEYLPAGTSAGGSDGEGEGSAEDAGQEAAAGNAVDAAVAEAADSAVAEADAVLHNAALFSGAAQANAIALQADIVRTVESEQDLTDAITQAQEAGVACRITLDGQITLTQPIQISSAVSIDLDGKAIFNYDGSDAADIESLFVVNDGGSLTISDSAYSASAGEGIANLQRHGSDGNLIQAANPLNVVTVEGGTFTLASGSLKGDYGVKVARGTVNVQGGRLAGSACGILLQGAGASAEVTGGEVSDTGNEAATAGVCVQGGAKLEASGGTISGRNAAIYMKDSGTAVELLNGSNVISSAGYAIKGEKEAGNAEFHSDLHIMGGTIKGDKCAIYYPQSGQLTIGANNQGPVITARCLGVQVSVSGNTTINGGSIQVSGGDDGDLSNSDNDALLETEALLDGAALSVVQEGPNAPEGVHVSINGGVLKTAFADTVQVHGSNLQGAVVAASGTFSDASVMDYLTSTASITLDLNKAINEPIVIPSGMTAVINVEDDRSIAYAGETAGYVITNYGELTLKGAGTLTAQSSPALGVICNEGKAYIEGLTVSSGYEGESVQNSNAPAVVNHGSMTVNDAKIIQSGANGNAIVNGDKNNAVAASLAITGNSAVLGGSPSILNGTSSHLSIAGGTYDQYAKDKDESNRYCIFNKGVAEISGGQFHGAVKNPQTSGDTVSDAHMTITGGQFLTSVGQGGTAQKLQLDEGLLDTEKYQQDDEGRIIAATTEDPADNNGGNAGGSTGGTGGGTVTIPDDDIPMAPGTDEEIPDDENPLAPGPADPMNFTDVPKDAWFYSELLNVYNQGITGGIGNNLFNPYGVTTRAQLVTMLYRMEGSPKVDPADTFYDTRNDSFYHYAAAWGKQTGIVHGDGNTGLFMPFQNITREQLAAILYRYAEYKGYDVSAAKELAAYPDGGDVAAWARPSMIWATGAGVIRGDGNTGMLNPKKDSTRAQMVVMIDRFLKDVVPVPEEGEGE